MHALRVVNPIGQPVKSDGVSGPSIRAAQRLDSFSGKTIGLFWNGKPQGDVALARTKARLTAEFGDVSFVEYVGDMGGIQRRASQAMLDRIAAEVDAVVGSTGDCGSCTSWLVRDMVEFEARGIPTAAWVARSFAEDATLSAEVFGCPTLPLVIVEAPFTNQTEAAISAMVDPAIGQLVDALSKAPGETVLEGDPRSWSELVDDSLIGPEHLSASGEDAFECLESLLDQLAGGGWSDGLPFIPPTPDRVERMVAAAGLSPDHVLGELAPGMGVATVQKVAANAVMAGCPTTAMPVILAIVECILQPEIGLRTWAMSTGPQAPVVLVSGPIADEIGINSGVCALGPGASSIVNTAIGRTLRLIMINIGHARPSIGDMDTIGSSLKYGACVGENWRRNPWPTFSVTKGYQQDQSTVTVNVPYGVSEVFDFENSSPESLLESFAGVARAVASTPRAGCWLIETSGDPESGYPFSGRFQNLIMMCPDHAEVFAKGGWSLDDIKVALHRDTQVAFKAAMNNKPRRLFELSHPELVPVTTDDTQVHLYPGPDNFEIFVVGGDAGRSLYFHGGTVSATSPITRIVGADHD